MPADILGEWISGPELLRWMRYDQVKPASEADLHAARICQVVAAIGAGLSGRPVPHLDTFLPMRARKPRGATGMAMKAVFLASCAHIPPPEADS